jgi:C4-dicarboxylate-binding protein DctP
MAVLAAGAMLVTAGCGGSAAGSSSDGSASKGGTVSIKFASSVPDGTSTGDAVNALAASLGKVHDVDVKPYLNATLYNHETLGPAVENGDVDIGVNATDWWANVEPLANLQDLPLLWKDAHQAAAAGRGAAGRMLAERLGRHGLTVLGYLVYGPADTFGTRSKAVEQPSDLKGQKVRSYGTLISKMLQTYGATPVILDATETYTAIQRGTVDGAFSASGSFMTSKWNEVIKHAAIIPEYYALYAVVANTKWWNTVSAAQQTAIEAAVVDAEQVAEDKAGPYSAKFADQLAQNGVQVTHIPESAYPAWRAPLKSVYDYYYKLTGADGRKLVQLAQSAG